MWLLITGPLFTSKENVEVLVGKACALFKKKHEEIILDMLHFTGCMLDFKIASNLR